MRIPVKCKNCGIKWERVIPMGSSLEFNWDIQLNCPKCGSNWYETIEEKTHAPSNKKSG